MLAILAAASLAACGPKLVSEPVFTSEDAKVEVELRRTLRGDEPVPRGYAHPVTISDVRLAHILAHLTFKDAKSRDRPIFAAVQVYDLAQGLNRALEKASPSDEVIAVAWTSQRNLGIFTADLVTAFRAYFEGDFLMIEFFAVNEKIEKDPRKYDQRSYDVPEDLPDRGLPIRLQAGQGHVLRGSRGFQIDWRDPFFRRAVSFSNRGQLRRRTILMEEEPLPEAGEGAGQEIPSGVSTEMRDAQLKALDQLDAARRSGLVTEGEFQRRRRLILEGKLDEAGYGAP